MQPLSYRLLSVGIAGALSAMIAVVSEPALSQGASTGTSAPSMATSAPAPGSTFDPRFRSCAHCHQIGAGARNTAGPPLNNLFGKQAGIGSYPYSRAMRDSGLIWDEPTLRRYLTAPQSVVPGTRMIFRGIGESELDGVIEFLKSAK